MSFADRLRGPNHRLTLLGWLVLGGVLAGIGEIAKGALSNTPVPPRPPAKPKQMQAAPRTGFTTLPEVLDNSLEEFTQGGMLCM